MNKFVYEKATEVKSPLVWTDRAKRLLKRHQATNIIFISALLIVGFVGFLFNPALGFCIFNFEQYSFILLPIQGA